mgnify:CR=1 FL=1
MVKLERSETLIWEVPGGYPDDQIGQVARGSGTDRFKFRKGITLNNVESPRVDFKKLNMLKSDYYPNNGDLLLVSDRLINVLNRYCPSDFQHFPANVFVAGKQVDGVRLLNVVSTVDAVDMKQSQYEKYNGTERIIGFTRLVFRKNCLGEHGLARAGEYKGFVLASRELALSLKEEGIRGISFSDPAEILL